jgi:hypothetical protein
MLPSQKEGYSTYDFYTVDGRPLSPSPVWPATVEGEMPNARVCCSTGYASLVPGCAAGITHSQQDQEMDSYSGPRIPHSIPSFSGHQLKVNLPFKVKHRILPKFGISPHFLPYKSLICGPIFGPFPHLMSSNCMMDGYREAKSKVTTGSS